MGNLGQGQKFNGDSMNQRGQGIMLMILLICVIAMVVMLMEMPRTIYVQAPIRREGYTKLKPAQSKFVCSDCQEPVVCMGECK